MIPVINGTDAGWELQDTTLAGTGWRPFLPGVIVDGAHNEDGVRRFVETAEQFQEEYPLTLLIFSGG